MPQKQRLFRPRTARGAAGLLFALAAGWLASARADNPPPEGSIFDDPRIIHTPSGHFMAPGECVNINFAPGMTADQYRQACKLARACASPEKASRVRVEVAPAIYIW